MPNYNFVQFYYDHCNCWPLMLLGFLQSNEGYVLKPLQLRQRGTNEVQFYEDVNSANSDDSVISELKSMMPKYYGQHCFAPADPEGISFRKFLNIMSYFI